VETLLEPPFVKSFSEVGNWPGIETPFALFNEQVEVMFGDATLGLQVTFGLVPKIFDSVGVIGLFSEQY
jgi:hypothetical protein